MSFLLQYSIKLSIGLAAVWLFYVLFLRRLTFYNINRWYLILYPAVALLIPFINISPMIEQGPWSSNELVQMVPVLDSYNGFQDQVVSLPAAAESEPVFTISDLPLLIFLAGAVVMMFRLVLLYMSFLEIRKKALLVNNNGVKLYQVNKDIIPFSFGNAIFINQYQHDQPELEQIIRHEFIHVKQKHSVDIIWAELLCILNWYNPFAWFIRKSIRQNLEFIADNQVLQSGLDKKQYQYLLLKVIGISPISIASNFNLSSLKTRIAMMNKMRSSKLNIARFLLLVPILAVMLLAFRNKIDNLDQDLNADGMLKDPKLLGTPSGHNGVALYANSIADTVPAKPAMPRESVTGGNPEPDAASAREPKPGAAKNLQIQISDNQAIVNNNGVIEKFNLNNPKEKKAFRSKYQTFMENEPAAPTPQGAPAQISASGAPAKTVGAAASEDAVEVEAASESATPARPSKTGFDGETTIETRPVQAVAFSNTSSPLPINQTPHKQTAVGMQVAASAAPRVSGTGIVTNPESRPVQVSAGGASYPQAPVAVNFSTNSVPQYMEGETILVIKRKTTKEQLEKLKTELAEKGYVLEINDIKFADGVISSISAIISKGKHKTSFSSSKFATITVTETKSSNGETGIHVWISDGKAAV
jgi:beta-lactamase regulating signal transducer with metallopeptidase domain